MNFIGCGRLGKALAALFHKNNAAIIGGVVNSSYNSALAATQFIGAGIAYEHINDLPPADIYFITTSDDAIQPICAELVKENTLNPDTIIVHCSGSLTSDILSQAKQRNCSIASIHPIKSFAHPEESIKTFPGTYCAMEGDSIALPRLKTLFEKIDAHVFTINKEKKSLYHAAGVLANNYLVTLHYQAVQAYTLAGIDDETANTLVTMLMTDAMNNLKQLTHPAALTGPLQRGDSQTISQHLQALKNHSEIRDIYAALGRTTLTLTEHAENKKQELAALLTV